MPLQAYMLVTHNSCELRFVDSPTTTKPSGFEAAISRNSLSSVFVSDDKESPTATLCSPLMWTKRDLNNTFAL